MLPQRTGTAIASQLFLNAAQTHLWPWCVRGKNWETTARQRENAKEVASPPLYKRAHVPPTACKTPVCAPHQATAFERTERYATIEPPDVQSFTVSNTLAMACTGTIAVCAPPSTVENCILS